MNYDIFRLNEADLGIHIQKHLIVQGASTLDNPKSETILFAKKMDAAAVERLEAQKGCLLILSDTLYGKLPETMDSIHECVYVENPRLLFAKALGLALTRSGIIDKIQHKDAPVQRRLMRKGKAGVHR